MPLSNSWALVPMSTEGGLEDVYGYNINCSQAQHWYHDTAPQRYTTLHLQRVITIDLSLSGPSII